MTVHNQYDVRRLKNLVVPTVMICVTASASQRFFGSRDQSGFSTYDSEFVVDGAAVRTATYRQNFAVVVRGIMTMA